jgi:hypothetical protein
MDRIVSGLWNSIVFQKNRHLGHVLGRRMRGSSFPIKNRGFIAADDFRQVLLQQSQIQSALERGRHLTARAVVNADEGIFFLFMISSGAIRGREKHCWLTTVFPQPRKPFQISSENLVRPDAISQTFQILVQVSRALFW